MAECGERAVDAIKLKTSGIDYYGTGGKMCIRIYDQDDQALKQIERYTVMEKLHERLHNAMFAAAKENRRIKANLLWWRWRWVDYRMRRIRPWFQAYVVEYLHRAHDQPLNVTVEYDHERNHRPIRDDELPDILAIAQNSSAFWLFVFAPMSLTDSKDELLHHML